MHNGRYQQCMSMISQTLNGFIMDCMFQYELMQILTSNCSKKVKKVENRNTIRLKYYFIPKVEKLVNDESKLSYCKIVFTQRTH